MDQEPDAKFMRRAFGLQFLGTCLVAFALSYSVQVWRPSVWGAGSDASSFSYAWMTGFFTWIGFYVPLQFGKISWEGKPWKLFFINAGHDLIKLQIISLILAFWR